MDTAQWPQEIMVKPMEEIVTKPGGDGGGGDQRGKSTLIRPQKEQSLHCPRCNSTNTKFCYYNNYSLTQPRYFCKSCRRYWTAGGSLRNIPVGGGSRKNKRTSLASTSSTSTSTSPTTTSTSSKTPKLILSQFGNLPIMENTSTSSSSVMELLTGMSTTSRGFNSFMPIPVQAQMIPDPNVVFSSGFSLPEFKPTLNFNLDGIGLGNGYGVQENSSNGRLLFPFEDLKQVSTTTTHDHIENSQLNRDHHHHQQGDPSGYWNGMLGPW